MEGEFETAKAIYQAQPSFSPRPITWGNWKSDPQTWFFLCTFHDFYDGMVDPIRFTWRLADLHRNTISPNGKFGFHVQTSRAAEEWSDTWEECFTKLIRNVLKLEWEMRGPDEDLARLSASLLEVIIPRLLRPLETEGRQVKPSLVHGDLWYGNACTDITDGEPKIFDGKALYAHNECTVPKAILLLVSTSHTDTSLDELGDWYKVRNRFGRNYFKWYHANMPISAPEEEFRDRNILYSLKYNIQASVSFSESKKFRKDFMYDIQILASKYPGPYPEYPPKY
ncbi:hypothetical protein MMC24_000573 [Lignoscripta atroalba]|nr:hypothetical protein [Lignoscripta atroalba]